MWFLLCLYFSLLWVLRSVLKSNLYSFLEQRYSTQENKKHIKIATLSACCLKICRVKVCAIPRLTKDNKNVIGCVRCMTSISRWERMAINSFNFETKAVLSNLRFLGWRICQQASSWYCDWFSDGCYFKLVSTLP